MFKIKIVTLICVVIFSGCAGTNFTWENARQLKAGMPEKDLLTLMGNPYLIRTQSDNIVYVWSYADTFNGAKSLAVTVRDNKVTVVPQIPDSFK